MPKSSDQPTVGFAITGAPLLKIGGSARIVSDLHLQAEREDLTQRFFAFLADTANKKTAALFILGDLFEYWTGDDNLDDPFNQRVCRHIKTCSDSGTSIYFIRGNRDFLIGEHFASATGITILPEVSRVGTGDTVSLLMHGDTICTDDLPYQAFRRIARSPSRQNDFMERSLLSRRAEVEKLRERSAIAMQSKTANIMDANHEAIRNALMDAGCNRLIHGHTHRPGTESIALPNGVAQRWVLSGWGVGRGDALELLGDDILRLEWSQ